MKATVLLVTYNHAPYIVQALDSVLGQVAGFPVGDRHQRGLLDRRDPGIVEQYARRHPDRIRLLLSERNRNDNEVIARGLRAAAGEFVAYLDGDDWWRVPHKLATQVRFLEQNPSCVMCYHSVLRSMRTEAGPPAPRFRRAQAADDAGGRAGPLLHQQLFGRFPAQRGPRASRLVLLGRPRRLGAAVLLSTRGAVGYVDEVMAAYRIHARGVWSGVTHRQRIEARLAFFDRLGADFRRRHAGAVRAGRGQAHLDLALAWEAEGRPFQAASHCAAISLAEPRRPVSLPRRAPSGRSPACSFLAGGAEGRAGSARDMTTPAVSVVIPTYQRRESVQRAIEALAGQTLAPMPMRWSSPSMGPKMEPGRCWRPAVSASRSGASGTPTAGRAAPGTPAWTRPAAAWSCSWTTTWSPRPACLAAHLEAHTSSHGHPAMRAVIGSAPIVTSPPSPLTLYLAARFQERLDTLARPGRAPRFNEAYTGNLSLARATLLEVGGFDESFQAYGHEDYEFALRLLKAGGELVFSPAAVAYQHQSKDFPALAKDAMARGNTAVLFARKHPEVAGDLKLGSFDAGTRKWRLLRSVMLALTGVFRGLPGVVISLVTALERRRPATAGPLLHDGARLLLLGRRTDGAPRSGAGAGPIADGVDRVRAHPHVSPGHAGLGGLVRPIRHHAEAVRRPDAVARPRPLHTHHHRRAGPTAGGSGKRRPGGRS